MDTEAEALGVPRLVVCHKGDQMLDWLFPTVPRLGHLDQSPRVSGWHDNTKAAEDL